MEVSKENVYRKITRKNSLIQKMNLNKLGLISRNRRESQRYSIVNDSQENYTDENELKRIANANNKIIDLVKVNILKKKLEKVDKEKKFDQNIKKNFIGLQSYIDTKEIIANMSPLRKKKEKKKDSEERNLIEFRSLKAKLHEKFAKELRMNKKKTEAYIGSSGSIRTIPKILLNPMSLEFGNRRSLIEMTQNKERLVAGKIGRTSLLKNFSSKSIAQRIMNKRSIKNNTGEIVEHIKSENFIEDDPYSYYDERVFENINFLTYIENINKKVNKKISMEETVTNQDLCISNISKINKSIKEILMIKEKDKSQDEQISEDYQKFVNSVDSFITEAKQISKQIYNTKNPSEKKESNSKIKKINSQINSKQSIRTSYMPKKIYLTETDERSKTKSGFGRSMNQLNMGNSNLKYETTQNFFRSDNMGTDNFKSFDEFNKRLVGIVNETDEMNQKYDDSVSQLRDFSNKSIKFYDFLEGELVNKLESLNEFEKKDFLQNKKTPRKINIMKNLKNSII